MRTWLAPSLAVLVLLTATSATGGEGVASETVADGAPADWPTFHVSLGPLYSPAPRFDGYARDFFVTEHLLDQLGTRVAFDWRFLNYGLMGGFMDVSSSGASTIVDTGMRGGALYQVDDHWAVYAVLIAEFAWFRVSESDNAFNTSRYLSSRKYLGVGAGGAVGFRYRQSARLGAFVEIAGVANRFDYVSVHSEESEDFKKPFLGRLQIAAGFLFGFTGNELVTPADGEGEAK